MDLSLLCLLIRVNPSLGQYIWQVPFDTVLFQVQADGAIVAQAGSNPAWPATNSDSRPLFALATAGAVDMSIPLAKDTAVYFNTLSGGKNDIAIYYQAPQPTGLGQA